MLPRWLWWCTGPRITLLPGILAIRCACARPLDLVLDRRGESDKIASDCDYRLLNLGTGTSEWGVCLGAADDSGTRTEIGERRLRITVSCRGRIVEAMAPVDY